MELSQVSEWRVRQKGTRFATDIYLSPRVAMSEFQNTAVLSQMVT